MKFKLLENMLFEDKMVHFGNEVSPKYGWCLIYVGGPGSGKSTATNLAVRLQGNKLDIDDLKKDKVIKQLGLDKNLVTPENERDLSNQDYVSDVHNVTKPLRKKVMKQQLNKGQNAAADRLPNLIFDIVGDPEKMRDIITTVKQYGYKVCIVWILTSVERAGNQSQSRARRVKQSILLDGHKNAIQAIEYVMNSNLINMVDELFVIDNLNSVNIRKDANGNNFPEDEYKWIRDTNVYRIPTNKNGFKEFQNLLAIINNNKQYLYMKN